MLGMKMWCFRRAQLFVPLIVSHWSTPSAAQGRREWAVSLGPQFGYTSIMHRLQGTLDAPGQFTMIDAHGKSTGMTFGVSAALTKRFWWEGNQTASGPIVSLAYANTSDTRLTIAATAPQEQVAADRVSEQLRPRSQRFLLQGGLGLTLFEGLLEGRFLLGGEVVNTVVPEFESPSHESEAALAADLGARLRLPIAETWRGYIGGSCGGSKHPLATSYSASCSGELGVEWVLGR